MKIEVLGTGCQNCNALERATAEALERLALDADIDKVTDYADIASYGVMSTPALAVDGTVVVVGWVPPVEDLTAMLAAASS